ncbi:MAG: hypothetical protein LBT97_13695 [Planctomycetota bacterium]|nr:hypothetical protein [Planctomycetota bacterium]
MAIYDKNAGAAARARMAKRAKRAQFIKRNKKRVFYGILAFFALVGLAIFTPYGPNWYWNKIQQTKMAGPGRVRAGAIGEIYGLGRFYVLTMRPDESLKIFDEIGNLYFGFPLSKYGTNADTYYDQYMDGVEKKGKGQIVGPPFDIDSSDISYVGSAMFEIGKILDTRGGRQWNYRMYKDLFVEILEAKHLESLDPRIVKLVHDQIDRFEGRK